MAKKGHRSGKPVPGGRVTPKGVRPDGPASRAGDDARTGADDRPAAPSQLDPTKGRQTGGQPGGQIGPTRAGHHRGQR